MKPIIEKSPASRTVVVGSTVEFQVRATGARPLIYQWYHGTEVVVKVQPGAVAAALLTLGVLSLVKRRPLAWLADSLAPLTGPLAIGVWLGCWQAGVAYGAPLPAAGAWWGVPAPDEAGLVSLRVPLQLLCAVALLAYLWLVERGAFDHSDYVRLIGVRPGERGRGVGRALMKYAEKVSRAQGRDLFLLVSDFNTDAQRFYQRLGFHQVGLLEDYVMPGVAELIYRKCVTKPDAAPDS